MLKPILRLLIVLLFISAALNTAKIYSGDDFGSPKEEKASEWATWLSGKVGLSSEQYTSVYNIYLKYAHNIKLIRKRKAVR